MYYSELTKKSKLDFVLVPCHKTHLSTVTVKRPSTDKSIDLHVQKEILRHQ